MENIIFSDSRVIIKEIINEDSKSLSYIIKKDIEDTIWLTDEEFGNLKYYFSRNLQKENQELKDKLHRRNLQIKELKKRIKDLEDYSLTFQDQSNEQYREDRHQGRLEV